MNINSTDISTTTQEVTVFILTVGDPAFEFSEKAVMEQSFSNFKYEVIKNVAPFNAACREMINRTNTDYFIQVDEDMILFPEAVGKMVEVIRKTPEYVGMVCFHLWDVDRELKIQGIKIYRTSIMKKINWQDLKASEINILDQFYDMGIKWVLHPEIVGNHGVVYSPETIYLRYKTMYEKDLGIFNIIPNDIYKKALKFKNSGDMNELFALFGSIHGIVNANHFIDKEKDFRSYNEESLNILKKLFLQGESPVYQKYNPDKEYILKNKPIPFKMLESKSVKEILADISSLSSFVYEKIQKELLDTSIVDAFNNIIEKVVALNNELDNKNNKRLADLTDKVSDLLVELVSCFDNNQLEEFYDIYILSFIPTFQLWKKEILNLKKK